MEKKVGFCLNGRSMKVKSSSVYNRFDDTGSLFYLTADQRVAEVKDDNCRIR
jgi:hypothetical protein